VFRPDYEKLAAKRAAEGAPAGASTTGLTGSAKGHVPIRIVKKAPPATGQPSVPRGFRKKQEPTAAPFGGERDKMLLERYQLIEKLGEGGTGIVYKAEDLFLKMIVAIKILSPALTHDKAAVAALKEEARIAMRLSHSHIVHLHNLEKAGDKYFLVMEHIEGSTYRELLNVYKHLPLDTVIETLRISSEALSYAHRHGVLHNDLKPENILITGEGILKIIDFGISCLINTAQADFIMGTPNYMSPEQIRGETLDVRTDVYSMGIMTYEFLTGKTPFPDNVGLQEVLDLLPVELPDVPDELRAVIQRAVDPDRGRRWGSVEAFAMAFLNVAKPLQQLISDNPEPPPEGAPASEEPPVL
jgi:serine/threonine-protein kinase